MNILIQSILELSSHTFIIQVYHKWMTQTGYETIIENVMKVWCCKGFHLILHSGPQQENQIWGCVETSDFAAFPQSNINEILVYEIIILKDSQIHQFHWSEEHRSCCCDLCSFLYEWFIFYMHRVNMFIFRFFSSPPTFIVIWKDICWGIGDCGCNNHHLAVRGMLRNHIKYAEV